MVTDKTAHDALVAAFVKAWYGIGKDEATQDDHDVTDAILEDLRAAGFRLVPVLPENEAAVDLDSGRIEMTAQVVDGEIVVVALPPAEMHVRDGMLFGVQTSDWFVKVGGDDE